MALKSTINSSLKPFPDGRLYFARNVYPTEVLIATFLGHCYYQARGYKCQCDKQTHKNCVNTIVCDISIIREHPK